MKDSLIFAPVLVQAALTLWLYIALALAKSQAVKRGEVDEGRRSLHDDAWPNSVLKINNNIRNQFELPVLFYVLIGILWSIDAVNLYIHITAWLFVISRIIHMLVHTGSNFVPLRRKVFTLGCVVLIGLVAFSFYRLLIG